MMQSRLATSDAKLPEREVDGIPVSGAENRCCLPGFSGSAGYPFITGEKATLATDFRYTEQATTQSLHFNVEQADALARDVIADAGYGDNFGHSLGHGVGFAVHEIPRVSPRSEDPLDVNSVFTVEPGIYLSGRGGVRIDDIVVLGQDEATAPGKASK